MVQVVVGGAGYGGQVVDDPYVLVLEAQNRSRRDIRSSDFDQDKPLVFKIGTRPLAIEVQEGDEIVRTDQDGKIAIGPALIRPGQRVRLTAVTAGRPKVTCPNPPLVGVKVREQSSLQSDRRLSLTVYSGMFGAALIIAGLVVIGVLPSHRNIGAGIWLMTLGFVALALSAAAFNTVKTIPKGRSG